MILIFFHGLKLSLTTSTTSTTSPFPVLHLSPISFPDQSTSLRMKKEKLGREENHEKDRDSWVRFQIRGAGEAITLGNKTKEKSVASPLLESSRC
ncbi:uncharacterized [Tachysurus ichikawai]